MLFKGVRRDNKLNNSTEKTIQVLKGEEDTVYKAPNSIKIMIANSLKSRTYFTFISEQIE